MVKKKPLGKKPLPPKRNIVGILFGWAYIAVAIALIALILSRIEPAKRLVCDKNTYAPALIGFGTCREE